jgi:DNA-binding MarR family transcriptional regulator
MSLYDPTTLSEPGAGAYAAENAAPLATETSAMSTKSPGGPRGRKPTQPGVPDPLTIQARRIAAQDRDDEQRQAPEVSLQRYYASYESGSHAGEHFRLTRALVTAARRWRKIANERVRTIGQSMARWETLFLVAFSGHQLSVSELANLVGIEGPTMVRMLQLLEQDGLITREQSEVDRRVTINTITPTGEQVIEDVKAITGKLREEVLHNIDPEELAITQRVLSQMILRLDELR